MQLQDHNHLWKDVTKDNALKAKTLWTLKLTTSHYSFKSSKDTSQLFSAIFPDSQIA